ncbi:MAG: hypothetical protein ACK5OH_00555, partial [bacterium]
HYAGAKSLGNATGYQYSHNSPNGIVAQDYLGVDRSYYEPVESGQEIELAKRWRWIQSKLDDQSADPSTPTEQTGVHGNHDRH